MDERNYCPELVIGDRTNDRSIRDRVRNYAINPPHLRLKTLFKKTPDYVQRVPNISTENGEAVYRNYKIIDTREGPTVVAWLPSRYKEYRQIAGVPGMNGPEEILLQIPEDVASAALDAEYLYQQGPSRSTYISATVTTLRTNEDFTVGEVRLDME